MVLSTGEERGFVWDPGLGAWQSDRLGEQLTHTAVLDLTADEVVTFTCMPPRTGYRAGVDRDGDFALDGDERDRGTDPLDPTSFPDDLRMDAGPLPMDAGMDAGLGDAGTTPRGRGGCSCRVEAQHTPRAGLWAGLVLALALGVRRRNRS